MVERRSSAAPSEGAQRLASQWRWGIEWHGRAARTPLTAAPTQIVLMERTCPETFSSIRARYPSMCIYSCFLLRFVFPTTRLGPESQFSDFLDGLGPAQVVGRQTLATPPMGKQKQCWWSELPAQIISSHIVSSYILIARFLWLTHYGIMTQYYSLVKQ